MGIVQLDRIQASEGRVSERLARQLTHDVRILDRGKIVAGMRLFGGTGKVEKTLRAREFGRLEKAEGLVVEFPDGKLKTEVRW